ncbi:MAG: hypothetical protein IT382_24605 [Deltaproteobacteria bacterium]|nr:hypothetical protein [Deltaproteobacteria bacterium]
MALAARQASEEPRPLHERERDIPRALSQLVMRLVSRDPARRPGSAIDLVEELRALAEGCELDEASQAATAVPELLATDHVRLEHVAESRRVRLARTSVPYAAAADIGESNALSLLLDDGRGPCEPIPAWRGSSPPRCQGSLRAGAAQACSPPRKPALSRSRASATAPA